jgi:hypothetical protein
MNLPHLREQFHRDREWPFTHENKWMAVQCTPKYNPVRSSFLFVLFIFLFSRMKYVCMSKVLLNKY